MKAPALKVTGDEDEDEDGAWESKWVHLTTTTKKKT